MNTFAWLGMELFPARWAEWWWGCWNVNLCSAQCSPCHLTLTSEWWLMACIRCQGTQGVTGDKHMAGVFCYCGGPRAFLCSHQLQHLLWGPSLARAEPPWRSFIPDGANELLLGSRSSSSVIHKGVIAMQGPSVFWLSSSCSTTLLTCSRATLLKAGFWHLSHIKHQQNHSRGANFAPTDSPRM